MTLEEFVIKILDTQNNPLNGMSRADYLAEGFEHIARCIYHDEDELEDFFSPVVEDLIEEFHNPTNPATRYALEDEGNA